MYGGTQTVASPTPLAETLASKLHRLEATLAMLDSSANRISVRIFGPRPEDTANAAETAHLHGLLDRMCNCAAGVHDLLGRIEETLATNAPPHPKGV